MLDEDRLDINEGICSHFFRLRAFDRRQLGVRAIDVTSLVHRRLYTQVYGNRTHYCVIYTTINFTSRGVASAGDTGARPPVRPTMSPYIKMTTDSLYSELTFDE